MLKFFVSIDRCKPKQTSNETNTNRKHRISITVTNSFQFSLKKLSFYSLLPIITQIDLMLVQGLFQLVYYYVSNRIDSLPTAYFFPDILYRTFLYSLKINSCQIVGSIFLKIVSLVDFSHR